MVAFQVIVHEQSCTFGVIDWQLLKGWLHSGKNAPKYQGPRQHGFNGFGRTHQFLEEGSRTHQFLAKFNMNANKTIILTSKGGNLHPSRVCRTHQLEILKPPLNGVIIWPIAKCRWMLFEHF